MASAFATSSANADSEHNTAILDHSVRRIEMNLMILICRISLINCCAYYSGTMKSIDYNGRQGVLKAVLACATASLVLLPLQLSTAVDERHLKFFHTHTSERMDVTYRRGEEYVPEGLRDINTFLSDFRNGKSVDIDPHLLDLLYDLREALGSTGTYEVISAYRSLETNEILRSRSSGVAKNSLHLTGQAIDIRLNGVALSALRDTAIAMQRGGVGYYASSNFVHVDTGRIRRW